VQSRGKANYPCPGGKRYPQTKKNLGEMKAQGSSDEVGRRGLRKRRSEAGSNRKGKKSAGKDSEVAQFGGRLVNKIRGRRKLVRFEGGVY